MVLCDSILLNASLEAYDLYDVTKSGFGVTANQVMRPVADARVLVCRMPDTTTLGAGSSLSRQSSSFETWRKLSSPRPFFLFPDDGNLEKRGDVKTETHLNQAPGNRPSQELTGLAFLMVYLEPSSRPRRVSGA